VSSPSPGGPGPRSIDTLRSCVEVELNPVPCLHSDRSRQERRRRRQWHRRRRRRTKNRPAVWTVTNRIFREGKKYELFKTFHANV